MQAQAALLPTVNLFNQFIYTQPNGTPSGVFVSNDGPHVYNNQAVVHGDIYAPSQARRLPAAPWRPRRWRAPRTEIAARGLIAVVVQNYYALVVARRKAGQRRAKPARGAPVSGHHPEVGAWRRSGPRRRGESAHPGGAAPARSSGCPTGRRQSPPGLRRPAVPRLRPSLHGGRRPGQSPGASASKRCPGPGRQEQPGYPRGAGHRRGRNARSGLHPRRHAAFPFGGLLLRSQRQPVRRSTIPSTSATWEARRRPS